MQIQVLSYSWRNRDWIITIVFGKMSIKPDMAKLIANYFIV